MSSCGGSFLIASPSLRDPNFHHRVVLILQHNEEGAFGLVVNCPVPVKDIPYPVFAGGPCEADGLFMLHGNRDWAELCGETTPPEIAPGIFLGDSSCTELLQAMEDETPTRVRMFAGYSGWGPGQLEGELMAGAWVLTSADGETLFNTNPKDLWEHLRPPSLPKPSLN